MKKISSLILFVSVIVVSLSCFENSMIETGEQSTRDPRLPEINIKQGGTDIPYNSGIYNITGARTGGDYQDVVFTIENLGTAELNLTGFPCVSIENDDANEFQVLEQPSETVLDSGRNITFSVRFSPISPQEKSVTVSILNDDFDEGNYSFTINGISVPDVDFKARLRRGIAPLLVSFESLSTGNISKLEWDFNGDGTVDATGDSVEHQFITPGAYTVVLNATGDGGMNYRIKTNYVTIGSPAKHVISDDFSLVRFVRAADIDGDSYIDVAGISSYYAIAGTGTNEISWWKNDGSGNFTKNTTPISSTFENPQYLSVADMDFDGDLDVICQGNFDGGQIYWWQNGDDQGGGDGSTWNEYAITASYQNKLYFDVFDMDGDSDLDLVSFSDSDANGYSDFLNYDENQVDEGYGWSTHSLSSQSATYLYLSDFNNDTYQDILVGGYSGIRWYQNSGDNTSYTEYTVKDISSSDNLSHKAVADIDNDGDNDIFSIVQYTDTEILWIENAIGVSGWEEDWQAFTITTDSKGIDWLRAFDVNNDGKVDLIGSSQNYGDIYWWENNGVHGNSSWLKHHITNNFSGACSVDAADFDGDGIIDILGAARYDGEIAWWGINHRDWYNTNIDSSLGSPQTLYPADIDSDGDLDVISGSIDMEQVVWYENDSTGSFLNVKIIDSGFSTPLAFYAVDLDKDNDIDIIVSGSNTIAWYENNGENDFTRHDVATDLSYSYSVYASDLNGDSEVDIICTSHYNNSIFWWDNDGSETFATKNILDNSINWPKSIAVGDIDGNGTIDVVAAGSGTSGLAWYENDGTGSFTKNVLGSGSNSVHIIDLDNDGQKDIVVYECIDNAIDWWKNNGSQNFSLQSPSLATGLEGDYTKIYISDINGDGDYDIASSNENGNEIAWWENDGNEGFTMHSIATGFSRPQYVHAADIDNDGDSDIMAVSEEDDAIVLWENNLLDYGQ